MDKLDHIEHEIWRAGMGAERTEFYRLARARKFSEESTQRFVREIDLIETSFT